MTTADEETPSVEQLWGRLEGAVGPDRIELLLQLSERLGGGGDYRESLSLADAALEAALADGGETLTAHAHVARGRSLYALEDYQAAGASHRQGAVQARLALRPALAAEALVLAGEALLRTDDLTGALACFGEAQAEALEAGEPSLAGRAAYLAGQGLWRRDDNEEALEALCVARRHLRESHAWAGIPDIDDLRATVLLELGRAEEAVEVLRAVLHLSGSLPHLDLPHAQYRLAYALTATGRTESAAALLDQAVEGHREAGNIRGLGRALIQRADCAWKQGDIDAALDLLASGRAHVDVCGEDDDVRACDARRAAWLHGEGRYTEAAELNETLSQTDDQHAAFWASTRRVDNLRAAGEPELCLEALDALDDLVRRSNQDWPRLGLGGPLWRLALRARCLASLSRVDTAHRLAEQAEALATDDDDPETRAWVHEILAGCAPSDADESGSTELTRRSAPTAADTYRASAIALYLLAHRPLEALALARPDLP